MEKLILYKLPDSNFKGDVIKRFASTLSLSQSNTADYVIEKDVLQFWSNGNKGFDFYPVKEEKELIIKSLK